jgi:hypothetical protein
VCADVVAPGCNTAAAASRRLQGPPDTSSARSSLPLSRTSSHDGDGLGVPPHFSFGRVRPESSSRTETAPSATKQKPTVLRLIVFDCGDQALREFVGA